MEWSVSEGVVDYEVAMNAMIARVDGIIRGTEPEMVWLLEHPPIYTAGMSAKSDELLMDDLFPVIPTTRGGKYSYHGPGQRVIYVMLDLKRRGMCDVRSYVQNLGSWIVNTLAKFCIESYFSCKNVGVWVRSGDQEKKIAAFGIRVRRWVTYHGISVNVCPDLSNYDGIVPCGITGAGVTSLQDLGVCVSYERFDEVLKQEFYKVFG